METVLAPSAPAVAAVVLLLALWLAAAPALRTLLAQAFWRESGWRSAYWSGVCGLAGRIGAILQIVFFLVTPPV